MVFVLMKNTIVWILSSAKHFVAAAFAAATAGAASTIIYPTDCATRSFKVFTIPLGEAMPSGFYRIVVQ